MAERATILIPDISGFTAFTSRTALDHSAHIINELLDLIVESNDQGFTLSEIEGDAVLFYRKGETLSKGALVGQCLSIFRNFHRRLKVIERDTVCPCGACQTATDLTLKFVVHHGDVKEIRVARFLKATGLDMIVAHRLLKNQIPSDEYVLITEQCLACTPDVAAGAGLDWRSGRETYPVLGEVAFAYADLSGVRDRLPDPPPRPAFVVARGDDTLEVRIDCPVRFVYERLINVDERIRWMLGVEKIDRDPVTERIEMRHNCQFQGMTLENICLHGQCADDGAEYVEQVRVEAIGVDALDLYTLAPVDTDATHLTLAIDWRQTALSPEMKQGILDGLRANLESFKAYCEAARAT